MLQSCWRRVGAVLVRSSTVFVRVTFMMPEQHGPNTVLHGADTDVRGFNTTHQGFHTELHGLNTDLCGLNTDEHGLVTLHGPTRINTIFLDMPKNF